MSRNRSSRGTSSEGTDRDMSSETPTVEVESGGDVVVLKGNGEVVEHRPLVKPFGIDVASLPIDDLAHCPTSMSREDPRTALRIFNAVGEPTIVIDGTGAAEFEVADWFVYRTVVPTPDTGEMVESCRTVFITPEGDTFATYSEVVMDRLSKLIKLYHDLGIRGNPRVAILQRTARRSRRVYQDLRVNLPG